VFRQRVTQKSLRPAVSTLVVFQPLAMYSFHARKLNPVLERPNSKPIAGEA